MEFPLPLGPMRAMQGRRCRSKFAKQSAIRQVPPVALAHLFDRFAVDGRWWKFYIYFICHQHPLKLKATPLCLTTIWSILTNGCRSCGASHPRCAGRGCDLMQNLPWCVEYSATPSDQPNKLVKEPMCFHWFVMIGGLYSCSCWGIGIMNSCHKRNIGTTQTCSASHLHLRDHEKDIARAGIFWGLYPQTHVTTSPNFI